MFDGINSKEARQLVPRDLVRVAQRKLALVVAAVTLDALRVPPNNRLESLKGERRGQYSIRINGQYRICFVWTDAAKEIEVVDDH